MKNSTPGERPSLYLWLSCEGWVRFGPFSRLRWRSEPKKGRLCITDEKNQLIAYQDAHDSRWRSTHPDYPGSDGSGWAFREPMVTSSPNHPHPHHFDG